MIENTKGNVSSTEFTGNVNFIGKKIRYMINKDVINLRVTDNTSK